jgi:DNA-binding transcriptional regulator YiaG
MPNIATALKTEIARVARKEIRSETAALKKATASYRHEIATLKKRVQDLERNLKRATRSAGRPAPSAKSSEGSAGNKQLRFSASRFAATRQKLGISAASMAKLLGVSSLSVYKWESGKTRPRHAQLEAIASVRRIGKREAHARLEQLEAA